MSNHFNVRIHVRCSRIHLQSLFNTLLRRSLEKLENEEKRAPSSTSITYIISILERTVHV